MFQKILFATTASSACEHAAHVAFKMARKYDATLYIFNVFGVPTHGNSPFVLDIKTGEEENMHDLEYTSWAKEEVLNIYADEILKTSRCKVDCSVGIPYREILRKARKENVDAIVMGSHTCVSNIEALHYRNTVGNTMQMVAKNARCPVFIISRPCIRCLWEYGTMVFATDFTRSSRSAFKFAASLSRQIGNKLLIFHSVDVTPNHFGYLEGQLTIEHKIDAAKQRMMEEYESELRDINHEFHVWEGIPHVELLKFSREKEADLVIMAHHNSESMEKDGFLGSMVEHVVLRSQCPVVSINHPRPFIQTGRSEMEKGVYDVH